MSKPLSILPIALLTATAFALPAQAQNDTQVPNNTPNDTKAADRAITQGM